MIYCVNDGAVMAAWSSDQNVPMLSDREEYQSIVHLYADPYAEVTERLDMEMTATGPKMVGLLQRCKRFALYVVNGTVAIKRVAESDDDPAGDARPDSTLAEAMVESIKEYNQKNNKNDEL